MFGWGLVGASKKQKEGWGWIWGLWQQRMIPKGKYDMQLCFARALPGSYWKVSLLHSYDLRRWSQTA